MRSSTREPRKIEAPAQSWIPRLTPGAHALWRRDVSGYRRHALLVLIVGAGTAVLASVALDTYGLYLASTFVAYAIAVMGARVLFGVAGVLSLAQATFIGVGAYAAAVGTSVLKLNGFYELLLVIGAAAAVSVVVAIPAIRVSGLRLALLTLAFGELFQWWVREQRALTGGTQGTVVDSFYIGSIDTTDPRFLFWMCVVFAGGATAVFAWLPRTQIGRNLASVRVSEFAARSIGVRVGQTRIIAFMIAGISAGITGFLVAHVNGYVSPTSFDLFSSVYILVGVILGGSGSVYGAWIGAAYITLLPPLFSGIGHERLYVLISGAVLIALIYALPGGLVTIRNQFSQFFTRRHV